MDCAKDYQLLVSTDGKLAFIVPARKNPPGEAPEIVYNGGSSALLYRTPGDILVLDNLHEKAREMLRQKDVAVVIEADYESGLTVYDYRTVIKFQK